MTSMASTGGGIEEGVGTASDGGAGAVDMEGNGDGKGAGERKVRGHHDVSLLCSSTVALLSGSDLLKCGRNGLI